MRHTPPLIPQALPLQQEGRALEHPPPQAPRTPLGNKGGEGVCCLQLNQFPHLSIVWWEKVGASGFEEEKIDHSERYWGN